MKKTFIILLLTLSLFTVSSFADMSGHATLLAVSMNENSSVGSTADLYLDIKPGTGRIFIDSYPLTKVDTQFSTRYANKIACDYINYDCSKYDFYYTISANSPIIGGPSAGGAITVLTVIVLLDKPVREDIAMTGTINSGGLIGPVGGLEPKITAAEKAGIKKVLIPKINVLNYTELAILINQSDIQIVGVANLDEAVYEYTGIKPESYELSIDKNYQDTMITISNKFCEDTKKLLEEVNDTDYQKNNYYNLTINQTNDLKNSSIITYERGIKAMSEGNYYSSASFCFGAGLKARQLILSRKNQTELRNLLDDSYAELVFFERLVDKKEKNNLWDLQTFMIVKERLVESGKTMREQQQKENISHYELAYSIERLKSAKSWSSFFESQNKTGAVVKFDKNALMDSCVEKISETESYLEYVRYLTELDLESVQEELDYAREDYKNSYYELCLFKASTAKAEITMILSGLEIGNDDLSAYINETILYVGRGIADVERKGAFPIIGYSYYEYAQVLKEDDPVASLLYLSYSSELSNLNLYLDGKRNFNKPKKTYLNVNYDALISFFIGLCVGILITVMVLKREKHKKVYANTRKRKS